MTTKDKAELLERIGPYEGCETADFWYLLTEFYNYKKDYMSEDFWLQVGLEIEIQFEDAVDYVMTGEIEIKDDVLLEEIKNYLKEY